MKETKLNNTEQHEIFHELKSCIQMKCPKCKKNMPTFASDSAHAFWRKGWKCKSCKLTIVADVHKQNIGIQKETTNENS